MPEEKWCPCDFKAQALRSRYERSGLFERVAPDPDETGEVTFSLPPDAFALCDDHNKYTPEAAKATIWISPDSASSEGTAIEILP